MGKREREAAKARIEALISEKGGYSKRALESLGVSWPPRKGWKKDLIHEAMTGRRVKCASSHKGRSFYSSWDWKRARYEAIRIHGNRCQCCGWRPGDTENGHLVVDHIVPRSKRPDLALDVGNLQVLCNDCNMGKSNQFADDFRDLEAAYRDMI